MAAIEEDARSEKEGLMPCYYTDAAQTTVFKKGSNDIDNTMVKWSAEPQLGILLHMAKLGLGAPGSGVTPCFCQTLSADPART